MTPIDSPEMKAAYLNYVDYMTNRFKGHVYYYELGNECPLDADLIDGNLPCVRTALDVGNLTLGFDIFCHCLLPLNPMVGRDGFPWCRKTLNYEASAWVVQAKI